MTVGPLEGLRVIDMTMYVSGPMCTQMLAELGAEVIKVERPPHGDIYRLQGPDFINDQSVSFLAMNRGKKSIVVDLKTTEGLDIVHGLLRSADVFVHNFKPGTAERLSLGRDHVAAISPRVVWAALSGYGNAGPRGADGGYDLIIQGELGLMEATGYPDRPPAKAGYAVVDITSGTVLAIGVLAALRERDKTGIAPPVESSLYEVATTMGTILAERYLATGELPERNGSASSLFAPYQAYRTADGYVTVGATGPPGAFDLFCEAIGAAELIDRKEYADNAGRVANQDQLRVEIEAHTAQRPTAHWVKTFTELGMPAGPIRSIGEGLDSAQTKALGLVVDLEHTALGSYRSLRNPIRLAPPRRQVRGAPLLGEHTLELLGNLGHSDDEITALTESGVVATTSSHESGAGTDR